MNCEACIDRMMDVLYGEELRPSACYEFFDHLQQCQHCHGEYDDLLETRGLLAEWTLNDSDPAEFPAHDLPGGQPQGWNLWPGMLRVAAAFLILVGVFAIADRLGWAGSERKMVSQTEMMEMVNDMIVVRQTEERKVIGRALMDFADQLNSQQRLELQRVSQSLQDLDRRYIQVMEETTEYLGALATR